MKSVWQPYGLSDFPLKHPMVGQDPLYHAFSDFLKSYQRRSDTANIFAVIARWGVGKSRFAMEVVSQWLQASKGWILQESGLPGTPLKEFGLDTQTLPIYLSYSDFSHPDSVGDNWLTYGIYRALEKIARDPDNSITGQIIDQVQSHLLPRGFIYRRLAAKLESGKYNSEELLDNDVLLDRLVKSGMEYLKEVKINDLLIFVDEVETMTEIVRLDQSPEKEEEAYHIDSEGLQVLGRGLKNDSVRKKYPFANIVLLCSPVVGKSITELGALQRRTHVMELDQISFSDVRHLIKKLEDDKIIDEYPAGLVEAVYSLSGGNMGWFNVIMYDIENYLSSDNNEKTLEAVFNHLVKTSNRFKRYIINEEVLNNIQTEDKYEHFVRMALLKQTPLPFNHYSKEQLSILESAKSYDGTELFKPYLSIKINHKLLTGFLVRQGYKHETESIYTDDTGNKIDVKILLRSLSLFSYLVDNQKDNCLVGTDEQSIADQLQMLYPVEGASQLARLSFEFLKDEIEGYKGIQYIGPNFAILQQLNRMYRLESPVIGYLRDTAANQVVEEAIKKILSRPQPEALLVGISRLLELNYPEISQFELSGVPCLQTTVQNGPYLDVHPKNKVTLIWGKDEQKLLSVLKDKKLLNQGFHPVIAVSDQPFDKKFIEKFSGPGWEGIGRCLIFLEISRLNRDTIFAVSVDKSLMDIRPTSAQLTTIFKNKITRAKDQLTEKIKEWFDIQDNRGWILRPILQKNASDHEIELIADGFRRMLIHLTTAAEIGVNPEFKMKSADYEEFRSLLSRSVFLGQGEKSNNYRETGLFNRHNDTYTANIPPSLIRCLAFLESSNKQEIEFENKFFFSCTQKVAYKKVIDQWIQFLGFLRLVRNEKGFITRVSSIDLDRKYELVRNWFEQDYPEMLKRLDKEIKGGSVINLYNQKPYLKKDLEIAQDTKNKIDFKSLSVFTEDPEENWSGELQNLDVFHEKCDFIFNKERFNSIKFDETVIRTLKIEDTKIELWYRIGHVFELIKYISSIRDKSVDLVVRKIDEIKAGSTFKEYQMPVSPLINILNRFKNELEWATDFDSTSSLPTVGDVTETLACSLTNYRFEEALNRLNRILSDCGLRKLDNADVVWDETLGICGKYKKCAYYFVESVDYLIKNHSEIEKWIQYFHGSEFADHQCVKNVAKYYGQFRTDLEQGLSERIDDKQEELENKPFEFVEVLEKELRALFEEGNIIDAELKSIKELATQQCNSLINNSLITAINKIRRKTNQQEYAIPLEEYLKQSTFLKTKSHWKSQEESFKAEGQSYFIANGVNTLFEFYIKVIEMKGDLDWDKYETELEELKRLGLVKTRVEII